MKIAIARAIIHSPLLVIADEPTGNLDEESSMEIMDIFQMLHKKGLTVIMVTHQKNIASFSERTLLIFDGEIKKDLKRNHLDNDQFEYIIQKNYEYLTKEAEEKWINSLK
jgi:putative ABC transport system ATP-binding protein